MGGKACGLWVLIVIERINLWMIISLCKAPDLYEVPVTLLPTRLAPVVHELSCGTKWFDTWRQFRGLSRREGQIQGHIQGRRVKCVATALLLAA